ncbi:helix-turn-helix domain-containing protein [Virgibacillus salexigens]|uniref:Putative transcriptional regulator n=1 Tax=Virgibacillus massiliensis TaxID=1462526 RepID=A0A024QHK8_9BACI|nr:helix-turn-helix transcriptional regulator [Virgibacillus massiliensis]CDQ41747.1 putative transcriptional regulator [Virgibacillus massiliensis]
MSEISRRMLFGDYIYSLRKDKGVTTREAGAILGISAQYVSLLERGRKEPSDEIINSIATYYKIESQVLFSLLKRIPLNVQAEIVNNEYLLDLIYFFKDQKNLSKKQKQKFSEELINLYNNILND